MCVCVCRERERDAIFFKKRNGDLCVERGRGRQFNFFYKQKWRLVCRERKKEAI